MGRGGGGSYAAYFRSNLLRFHSSTAVAQPTHSAGLAGDYHATEEGHLKYDSMSRPPSSVQESMRPRHSKQSKSIHEMRRN